MVTVTHISILACCWNRRAIWIKPWYSGGDPSQQWP